MKIDFSLWLYLIFCKFDMNIFLVRINSGPFFEKSFYKSSVRNSARNSSPERGIPCGTRNRKMENAEFRAERGTRN